MESFAGLRDCNATLRSKDMFIHSLKTWKGSWHTAVVTD